MFNLFIVSYRLAEPQVRIQNSLLVVRDRIERFILNLVTSMNELSFIIFAPLNLHKLRSKDKIIADSPMPPLLLNPFYGEYVSLGRLVRGCKQYVES